MGSAAQLVHIDIGGQDDNLGDSALRQAYLQALRGPDRLFRLVGGNQSSDYLAGFALTEADKWFTDRRQWAESMDKGSKPALAFGAGEINPRGSKAFPTEIRHNELTAVRDAGGAVIIAGIGLKDTEYSKDVKFVSPFRDANIVSWRDSGSQAAAGFGETNPDWAFSLGSKTSSWAPAATRKFIAVTLRFDRPYPDAAWISTLQRLAKQTSTQIITVAQVARDAPRAVRLAADLDAMYMAPPSFAHDALDAHVRNVFQRSLAVVSDRAHGLIIAATEGAYPIGSAANPHKISRLLDEVGLGSLVGAYGALPDFVEQFASKLEDLPPAINVARERLSNLTARIHGALEAVAP